MKNIAFARAILIVRWTSVSAQTGLMGTYVRPL